MQSYAKIKPEKVYKSTAIVLLKNCCKCRKYGKNKHFKEF